MTGMTTPSHEPRWHRCLDCNEEFAVAEKVSPVVKLLIVKHCPYCGRTRLHQGFPAEPGRWR